MNRKFIHSHTCSLTLMSLIVWLKFLALVILVGYNISHLSEYYFSFLFLMVAHDIFVYNNRILTAYKLPILQKHTNSKIKESYLHRNILENLLRGLPSTLHILNQFNRSGCFRVSWKMH